MMKASSLNVLYIVSILLCLCGFQADAEDAPLAQKVEDYRKAAEQGDAKAQFRLGFCYDKGTGVAKDIDEAVKWYRKAAEQGYADSQYRLGLCYENGKGMTKDASEAVKWYRKAAEQGDAKAQSSLGVCYFKGEGVTEDLAEAVKWHRKAAEQERSDAKRALKDINVKDDKRYPFAGVKAIEETTDQATLAAIALESKNETLRFYAVQKVTDELVLAKILSKDNDARICVLASHNIKTKSLTEFATTAQDPMVRVHASILLKIRNACESIPSENGFRQDRIDDALTHILPLTLDCVAKELGPVESIRITWSQTSSRYGSKGNHVVKGESTSMTIKMGKLKSPLVLRCSTDFPDKVVSGTSALGASYDTDKYYSDICGNLTTETICDLANRKDCVLRIAAISNISDEQLLVKVAIEDEDYSVRNAAIKRIANQHLLAKIVLESEDYKRVSLHIPIVERITDQQLLKQIEVESEDRLVREAAKIRLNSLNSHPTGRKK